MPRPLALLPLLLAASACTGGGSSSAPPGEDRQLDQAAASLDANGVDANAAEIIDEPEANDPADNSQ